MRKLFLMAAVTSLISTISFADSVLIENTPNPGDTTTVTTITTGNPVITGNLLSQDWTDGSWEGTMFPDSSDINESIYLTGKDGKYAESTIQSEGILTEAEIQQGLTSTLSAEIRWWNQWESTVLMTQTAIDSNGTTVQNILLEDTTNHNYQFNTYSNTLIIAPDTESTHGSLTARFTFDVDDAAGNWNGGHSGVDVVRPELKLDFTALSETTVTTVQFCYQKNPPTCPAQEEIADVVDTIDEIFEEDYSYEDTYINTEYIEYEYDWNDDYFYDDIYEEEEYFEEETAYYLTDDFFFETEYYDEYESDYVEYDTNIELEEFDYELNEDYYEEEYSLAFDDLPIIDDYFDNEEMYFEEDTYFDEDMYIDAFTDDEFIEDFDEMFEEMPMEEMDIEMAEEMFEEMFEEYFEEPPMEMTEEIFEEVFEEEIIEEPMEMAEEIIEEPMEEDIIEEEPMDEPPMEEVASVDNEPEMEKPDEVEEQPSSESPVADEPQETADAPQQEEADEEPTELAVVEGGPTKEQAPVEQDAQGEPELETELDFKIAAIEKVIKSQIKNTVQRTTATLNVINEIVSREMISQQPDMSSYFNMNAALFDTRQLPSGNPAFFNQISLDTYDYTIYNEQVAMVTNMVGQDPVVQHEKKMRDINSRKTKVLIELKEMLNARSN